MFGEVLGEDQDVVKVDHDLSFGNKIAEDVVHHLLEHCGQIGESKEHNGGFEEAPIGMEGHLLFVSFPDSDVVVSPMNVELGEVLGTSQFGDEFGDQESWVAVLDCHFI